MTRTGRRSGTKSAMHKFSQRQTRPARRKAIKEWTRAKQKDQQGNAE